MARWLCGPFTQVYCPKSTASRSWLPTRPSSFPVAPLRISTNGSSGLFAYIFLRITFDILKYSRPSFYDVLKLRRFVVPSPHPLNLIRGSCFIILTNSDCDLKTNFARKLGSIWGKPPYWILLHWLSFVCVDYLETFGRSLWIPSVSQTLFMRSTASRKRKAIFIPTVLA